MTQLVTPNLKVYAQIYRCLQYVQDAFGAPWAGNSAYEAWLATQFKHTGVLPTGVYVPVWFSYYGTVDGVTAEWGHVVVYKDGTCWSSPYTDKNTCDVLGSIAEVERIYSCTYLGWSEDIGGLKVIGGTMDNPVPGDAQNLYPALYGKVATPQQIDFMISRSWKDWSYQEIGSETYQNFKNKALGYDALKAENDKLKKQVTELEKNSCTTDERDYLNLLKKVSK